MKKYQNIDRDSGVDSFEIGLDYIRIKFSNNSVYLYTYSSAGREKIEKMKVLAELGEGLNSFINRVVKRKYEKKEK